MRRQVPHAPTRATSRKRALAAVVLTPWLALQGCAKSEEQPEKGSGTASAGQVKGLIHAGTSAAAEVLRTEDGREYVAGQLLVHFKPGTSMALTSSTHGKLGTKVLHTFRTRPELQVVQVDPAAMDSVLAAYRLDARVAYAEPNFVYRISALPNDTRFGELWGMHNTGQSAGTVDVDINAPEAWDLLTGSETAGVVTVIDTGVDYTHPDLTANMWVNPGEIAGNRVDDDGNGYVDDVHGINAITNSGDPKDDNEHGTHVSGTIAGRGNNALGVAGVNWTAKVMGCKFLDASGSGATSDAIKCLDYVHMMKTRAVNPVNVIATSNSWGGGSFSQTLMDAVAQQREDGILFVAAAGNDALNNDTTTSISYPASFFLSNVIAVASHDRADRLSSFSTYGRRTIHVAAPGSAILSSVPGGTYASFDGTSMATPHVTGLVALLKAQDPSRDWKQLKNLVLTGAVSSTGATSKTLTGKRIRAADTGGKGSLTCANQVLNTRVRPIANTASMVLQQQPLQLMAYNIKCDAPNGPPIVTVTPGGGTITFSDSGTNGDQTAGDGLYTGYFEPLAAGTYTLTFPDNETFTINVTAGYVENPAPYAWRTITGTSLNLTDDSVAPVTSPFGIPIGGGTPVTALSVGMNGGIRPVTGSAVTFSNSALPTTSYSTFIVPFWDDLFPGPTTATDNVFWAVTGTAPNRELVVEWRNVHHRDTRTATPANTVNFQVVFFEGKSDILYNYKDVLVGSASFDKGGSATVGVQVSSTNATQRSFNSATLENEMAILWTIPAPATAPVLSEVTASPTTLSEGEMLELGGTFTDPDGDGDGPFRLEFDLNHKSPAFVLGPYQTTSTQGTVATSAMVRSSGTVTVAARAVDRRGSRSAVKTVPTTLTVTDVAPVLAAITPPEKVNEKQAATFTTSFTDPGLDAPWRVQWDWDYDGTTFTVDQTVNATTAGPVSVSRTFAQDGTYTVAARITDKDGVMSNVQVLTVNVADLKPLVDSITSPTTRVKESQTLEFASKLTDPGDGSKPWRIQWDYDYDGTTFTVDSEESYNVEGVIRAKRSMNDSGAWTYALRVVDADGSISELRTLDVIADEVSPVLADYTARPLSSFEGEPRTVSFSLKAASGATNNPDMDPVRNYLWDFDGDGTFDYLSLTPEAIFTYRDNPAGGDTYAAIVRVEDEDTYTEQSVAVVVRNVAPTLVFMADQSISEGRMLMTRMQATDPGNDTVTYSLSGAPEGMSITADGLLVWTPGAAQVETPYAVTVIATDDDGDSSSQVVTFTARNMAPTLAAIPGRSVNEGSLLSVRAQASDMGNGSLSFSLSGAPEGMSITADGLILWTPGAAQAGASYPVTVTVTDTYGASASQSFTVEARNVAPTLAALKAPASINAGSLLSVRAQAHDVGNGTLSFSLSGAPAGMSITADGLILWTPGSAQAGASHTVTVTVADEHGASASQSFTLEVRNVGPTLAALKAPASINEGSLLSVHAQASSPSNSTLSYSLSGAPAGMSITANGLILWTPGAAQAGASYTVTVTVTDEHGASASETFTLEARNVAPTLAALKAPASINEGRLLSVRAQASDPGNGTLGYSLSGAPEGMSITADGLVLWTPAFAQTSASGTPYTVTVTVTDEHGASASQSFTLAARWMDTDGDGMPDSWERANGTDPMRDDASGDTDGDGVSNLDEFNSSNGGPVLPETAVAKSPLTGTQVDNATLVLSATHAKSVGSVAAVRYQFQLFSDVALTDKVRDVTVDQEASGDTTSASLTDGTESTELVDLQDNHTYAWRVRVTDGTLSGPWSQVQRIRYNPLNDLPGAPRPVQPVAGSQVSTLSPVLVVDNVMDADDATLTYRFELAEDATFTLARQFSDVAAGARGSTSWTVAGSLKPFVTYYWRATAMDPHGGSTQGTVSSFSVFVGRPVNRAPGAPALVSPAQDVKVASATPALVVNAAMDSDGDALTYVFELDTSATFGGSARQMSSALTAVDGKVGWTPATLQENGRYFWRVRALDAVSTSDWAMGTFVVNAHNDAPSAPVTLNPSEAVVATRKPTLTVQNAVDPEGDAVTYTFEVRKQGSSDVVASASNVAAGANRLTSVTLTTELDEGGEYVWVARATDAQGAASAASAEASFLVFRRPGNDTKAPVSGGCNSGPGGLGGLLPLMALALGLLGRRRR
ncbi:S8 family serine peptidase [Archangium sp.]|uniref:S8 family serine peptidase n=1 Tax=Archangium sp. TaxID=1872627 RepID=UPI00286C5011|nr:S8 family serine peptidase [Archangium sp.]